MTPSRGYKATDRWRRRIGVALIVVVALEIVYVVAVNAILGTEWLRDRINMRPERVLVQWETARSWFPGHVSGTGLWLRTQSPRVQSLTEADRFLGFLSPFGWSSRSVTITGATLENLRTQVRPARMLREAEPVERSFFPEIPGLAPLTADSPPATGPFRPGWIVNLDGLTLAGEHHVRVGNYEIHGVGRMRGSLSYRVRDQLAIDGIEARLSSVRVSLNGEPLVQDGTVAGRASALPFVPYFHPGMAKLAFFSTDAEISSELSSLQVLNFYLGVTRRENWPGLSAKGRLAGRLVVEEGKLSTATDLALDAERVRFQTETLTLQSAGKIRLQPAAEASGTSTLMRFELADLALRHRTYEKTLVATRNLTFFVDSEDTTIGTPLREIDVRARIDRSEVPDVAVFNHFIPSKIPLSLTTGKGDIGGEIAWRDGRMQGGITLESERVELDIEGQSLSAAVRMDLNLGADPESRTVSIGGTTLRVDSARLVDGDDGIRPWSGEVRVETGRVEFREGARESIKPGRVFAQLIDFTDGELKLSGDISDVDFLDYLLTEERRLTFAGEGRFNANLWMEAGTISAGSSATYQSSNLAARFLDFEARGVGRLQAAFHREASSRILDVRTLLEDVALVRRGEDVAFVRAPQVLFRIDGRAPDVTEPLEDIAIRLDIDQADVPDITVYNDYLPKNGVLRLKSGNGTIRTRFDVNDEQVTGHIELDAPGVNAVVNERELAVDLDMDIVLSNGDLDSRRFDLAGSRLAVSNVNYPDGRSLGDWSTVFGFTEGELHWTRPVSLSAQTRLDMTSSGPLVEVLAGSYGQLRWARDLLSVNDVVGTSRLEIGPDHVVLNGLDIRGEDIQIAANLRIDDAGPRGIVFNRYGPFRATVEFEGDERDWTIFSARERFDRHPGF